MSSYNPIKEGAKGGATAFTGCLVFVALLILIPILLVGGCAAASSSNGSPPAAMAPIAPTVAPAPVPSTPAATAAPAPASPPASCPAGFRLSSWGDCKDERHQPCPPGYTGWQNSQLDNCMEKPS